MRAVAFQAFRQQTIEAERRDAGIFALQASDVPEAGPQLDGAVDGRRTAENQGNRTLNGRRQQHGLIARGEIAAHDNQLSLVKTGVGKQGRGRHRPPRRDLGVRQRCTRCHQRHKDTEGGAGGPHVSFDCTNSG